MFSLGLALFTLSSAACGLPPSSAMLVLARLCQGGAAALLTPNVLSLIGLLYTEARDRALSAYGMTMGLAAMGGQLIGGVLVQSDLVGLGSRSCFLINAPIGAGALAWLSRRSPIRS
jgi:MFS family permease